jgi:hypothetical protein
MTKIGVIDDVDDKGEDIVVGGKDDDGGEK